MSHPDYCPIGKVPCQSLCDTPCGTSDALQGAADWLCQAVENCTVVDIQLRLLIGYNRARRLFDRATMSTHQSATDEGGSNV